MEQTKHYILYKTTCTATGNFYIGVHCTKNLEDGYLGSGLRLRYSIQKHGKESHVREVLEKFDSKESMLKREREIVNEELLSNPKCMNLQKGGNGGFGVLEQHRDFSSKGGKSTAQRRNIDREFDERRQKEISRQNSLNHANGKMKVPNWQGKSPSLSHRASMSIAMASAQKGEKNSQFGTVWIFHPVEKRNLKARPEQLAEYLKQGWCKGRIKVA